MSLVQTLLREDLRGFTGYASARRSAAEGRIWLNANESPWPSAADREGRAQRYPSPQPASLRAALATLYGVSPAQVLLGRGSDEAIDLLLRAFCRAGRDAVVIAPPVFGMYAVCARLQGAALIEVPLRDRDAGFVIDIEAMADAAVAGGARLLFLCSPANPTGATVPQAAIEAVLQRLAGQCLVVVDEAYIEYAEQPSAASLIDRYENLVVLRTLSKAHALAAARVGCLLASAELVSVLRDCQAPYPLPTPCVQLALAALSDDALAQTRERVVIVRRERERVRVALADLPGVSRVYRSEGNYLLVRFADADDALQRLLVAGVVVRDMRMQPQLGDALRISIGTPADNDALLSALRGGRG
ncbi:MAG TPA: histidinol-phosphate transaminase [Arenimonas sp.]|nr:histidinol-phosphate transaminase [Arenimonas sp.]